MLLKNIILSLLLLVPTIYCQNSVKNNNLLIQKKSVKQIIFWGPAKNELDSTINNEDVEVYSDYYYYIVKVTPTLRQLGIEIKDTTSPILKINYDNHKVKIFKRENKSIGYIFNNGEQEPILIKYVMTDTGIISKAKNYFHIR